jgi:DNA ligase-1
MLRELVRRTHGPGAVRYSYDYVGDLAETMSLVWTRGTPGSIGATTQPRLATSSPAEFGGRTDVRSCRPRLLDQARRLGPLRLHQARHRRACASASPPASPSRRWPISAAVDVTEIESSGTACSRPTRACSPGWRARAESRCWRRRHVPLRSCCPIRSGDGDLESSIRPTTPPNGNGTASASSCRGGRHPPALFALRRRHLGAFPDIVAAIISTARSTANCWSSAPRAPTSPTGTFSDLQQRLNRKTVTPKMQEEYPAFIRAYDLLRRRARTSARVAFTERRARLETFDRRRSIPTASTSRRWSPSPAGSELEKMRSGSRRSRHRRRDAEAARLALPCRPPEGSVVQVEA